MWFGGSGSNPAVVLQMGHFRWVLGRFGLVFEGFGEMSFWCAPAGARVRRVSVSLGDVHLGVFLSYWGPLVEACSSCRLGSALGPLEV